MAKKPSDVDRGRRGRRVRKERSWEGFRREGEGEVFYHEKHFKCHVGQNNLMNPFLPLYIEETTKP